MEKGVTNPEPRLFVSYSLDDRVAASQIIADLVASGIAVLNDEWQIPLGSNITDALEKKVATADVILLLLSRHSIASSSQMLEISKSLGQELKDRGVRLIPAILESCQIPEELSGKTWLDLSSDRKARLNQIVEYVQNSPRIQLSRLTSGEFEEVIFDLLVTLGFVVSRNKTGPDFNAFYDYKDPFGETVKQLWAVEVKHQGFERISVNALRQMFDYLAANDKVDVAAIVTSGQLTSEARSTLTGFQKVMGNRLRMIEREQIIDMLVKHPDLLRKHFSKGE